MNHQISRIITGALVATSIMFLAGCQEQGSTLQPSGVTPPPPQAPAIPFSKGPTSSPNGMKGPSDVPRNPLPTPQTSPNSATTTPSSAVTEKDNVHVTIPPSSAQ